MKTILFVLGVVVTIHAFNLFKKKEKEDYCKDSDPKYCAAKVPKGFCESQFHTKQEIKNKCMKSCGLCCGDRDPDECKKKKETVAGFCQSSEKELKATCGATCGLCAEPEGRLLSSGPPLGLEPYFEYNSAMMHVEK
ncbi:shTK domain protein [Ostertagia ostertagi]